MEKLELLSHTALLKQGIERTNSNASEQRNNISCEKVVLVKNNNRMSTGIPPVTQSRHLLSAAAGAGHHSIPNSKVGEGRSTSTSPLTHSTNATSVVGSNLASPVSTDVEDEDDAGVTRTTSSSALSKTRHNLHVTKALMIESRSPITTVEYGHFVAAPTTSLYPSSPQSYGYSLLPNHNQIVHGNHSQDQQEYPPSQYNNHNGNIIRTLSEASFATMYGNSLLHTNAHNGAAPTTNNNESDAAFHPPQRESQVPRLQLQQRRQPPSSVEDMTRQIRDLHEQLKEKDMVVSSLQHRVNYLENQIHELRQLPTGKISHIPVDDMIRIMQEYGSEVSNQTLPQQRKQNIKKASIVRQFRRWNPDFFRYFLHHNGEWVPKLGREGELRRRTEKRRLLLIAKQTACIKANGCK